MLELEVVKGAEVDNAEEAARGELDRAEVALADAVPVTIADDVDTTSGLFDTRESEREPELIGNPELEIAAVVEATPVLEAVGSVVAPASSDAPLVLPVGSVPVLIDPESVASGSELNPVDNDAPLLIPGKSEFVVAEAVASGSDPELLVSNNPDVDERGSELELASEAAEAVASGIEPEPELLVSNNPEVDARGSVLETADDDKSPVPVGVIPMLVV